MAAEEEARKAQAEQAALAAKEEKKASERLQDQQKRLLRGKAGRTGLLFGSELGVQGTEQGTAQTLGG